MLNDDIAALVKLARQGDQPALAELVAMVQRDLRVFIAAFAASREMAAAVFAEAWELGQRDIVETQDMTGWLADGETGDKPVAGLVDRLRAYARSLLRERLASSAQQAVTAQDTLLHVVARAGSEALQTAGNDTPPMAAPVAERLKRLPRAASALLDKRYRDRLSLAAIATAAGCPVDEVARGLHAARSAVDWQSAGQAQLHQVDRRLPVMIEEFIAGSIDFDQRSDLGESLVADLARAASFERQIRLDLVLDALLQHEIRHDLAAAVAGILPGLTPAVGAPPANRQVAPARSQSDQFRPVRRAKTAGRSTAPLWSGVAVLALVMLALMAVYRMTGAQHPSDQPVRRDAGSGDLPTNASAAGFADPATHVPTLASSEAATSALVPVATLAPAAHRDLPQAPTVPPDHALTASAYISDFSANPAKDWLPSGGSWTCVDGSYRHTSAGGVDLSIYGGGAWADSTFTASVFPRYDNPYGVVFAYQDPQNYCGVSIKDANATLFRIVKGVKTQCAQGVCAGTGKWKWSTLAVTRAGRTATLAVNGSVAIPAVEIGDLGPGRIGLLTEWSQVDFGKITVTATQR